MVLLTVLTIQNCYGSHNFLPFTKTICYYGYEPGVIPDSWHGLIHERAENLYDGEHRRFT